MAVREPHNPSRPNGQAFNFVSGSALSRLLRGKSPQERAAIIAQLIRHDVAVVGLLAVQGARLGRVSPTDVSIALGRVGKRGPHEKTVTHLVKRYSADALMRAVDRITSPIRVAAE